MEMPKLELPQRVAVKRSAFDRATITILLICLVGFGGLIWFQLRGPAVGRSNAAGGNLNADQLEQLALRLEDKNLAAAAAQAWSDYLAAAALPAEREAKIRAKMGRLQQSAGQYEEAVANYYRAETLAGANKNAIGEDVSIRVRDCFREMGRYGELAREVEERTSINAKSGELAGRQIVAEIGSEKITASDLDRMMQDELESMMRNSPGMSASQMDAMRQEAHKQFSKPEARAQMLQQFVLHRVLAREARERKLDQSPAYKARLIDQADDLLSAQLMMSVSQERATVTPEDVQRFYAANAKRYEIPARGSLAQIVCKSKEDAAKVIELLDGGATFEKLAQDRSTDGETKSRDGKLSDPILPTGDAVPGAGDDKELHAKLWNLKAGEYTKESCQVGDGWIVYQMTDKHEAKTPTLEQIRDRVEGDCRQARGKEVMQQFVDEMLRKYDVKIHGGAMAATSQPTNSKGS